MASDPIWAPSTEQVKSAQMTAFIKAVSNKHALTISSYSELYDWSIANTDKFWSSVWSFCNIKAQTEAHTTCSNQHLMRNAKWFQGASLNFAENLLRYRDSETAIVFKSEHKKRTNITFSELYDDVSKVAHYLSSVGVTKGDRIAAYLPNLPETIIALLAASSLGAVWSSCSPDFGLRAVMDRFSQIEPKILFVADGYHYNGKSFSSLEIATNLANQIPSIERVVVVPFVSDTPNITSIQNSILFSDIQKQPARKIRFTYCPFEHPLYILYSSGTTGIPKCIVHSAGGTLVQHLKELVLHTDLRRSDKIFYYTTCGWMMWNWLVSSLAVGATVLLYDGSPFYPNGNTLFEFAESENMTVFGTSAKYISAVEKAGLKPKDSHDLSALRAMLSTGSPLLPENFDFVYSHIKEDIQLSSISGGTDIISCFCLGNPIAPIHRGEIQTRGLGMKVEVYNQDGVPVVKEQGELVCTKPFPSMPIYFWNDPDGQKYKAAYFNTYENVWRHGDWAEITKNEGVIIYGRSDAVLNPGGVRIGTSEIYQEVEQLDEVIESIAVGQSWQESERIVLFVKLREGITLDTHLIKTIKTNIRKNTTARHVPSIIIQVPDIPKTINGKIVELAVKNIIHNKPVKNMDALANPEALEFFKNLQELKT